MEIKNNSVVSIHYTLKNEKGEVLDSSEGNQPLKYLQGSGQIITGLENTLAGKTAGAKLKVVVEPEDGYGPRNDEAVQEVPKAAFEGIENLKAGMQLEAQTDHGPVPIVVTDVGEETVTVDGNHPLAGERLHFDVQIEEVRAATEEEIEHGHAH
ncbi:MAG: peptidylprolyl isomerase [Gemmatimonadetes bacterium]|nr:peptidylprolyl isomerase [Gemmatimonadota bacterium]